MRGVELIAVVVVRGTVHFIGAALDGQIDRAARVASALRVRLGLRREFVDRVQRHHYARNSRYSALIHRRNIVPEVVVVRAVDLPVHLVGARSIERPEPAHGITSVARCQRDQLRKIAPVHGYVLQRCVGDRVALGHRGGVNGNRRRRNLNRRGLLPHSERHRQSVDGPRRHWNLVHRGGREPASGNRHLIRAGRHVLERVLALGSGNSREYDAGPRVRCLHNSARQGRSCLVSHGSVDGTPERL